MKHNDLNQNFRFVKEPEEFSRHTPRDDLQFFLGGTQYLPGTRDIADLIVNRSIRGLNSIVACLEDAVAEEELPRAEETVLAALAQLSENVLSGSLSHINLPLIFVRVRSVQHFATFLERLDSRHLDALAGFVFPKFDSSNAAEYFQRLRAFCASEGRTLYAMPIIEGALVAHVETRRTELIALRESLANEREYVLNVRIGGTDFSSFFGVRRSMAASVYDILPVRDIVSDIINVFGRSTDGYVLSGAVWEYFLAKDEQDLGAIASGRLTDSLQSRAEIINPAVDGLLRELLLDKANGLIGKTVIHPSHLRFVNAMQAVTFEEYEDALQILGLSGGVIKSPSGNKMNERNPHRSWAEKVLARGRAYGVIESEADYLALFTDSHQRMGGGR